MPYNITYLWTLKKDTNIENRNRPKERETNLWLSKGEGGRCLGLTDTHCCAVFSHSVVSNSLWSHGPQLARVPCSWGFFRQEEWSWLPCPPPVIFPIQGLNPGFPHCRQILYYLSHQGIPRILESAAYPFSRETSPPRNWSEVSYIVGGFLTSWATSETPRNTLLYIK